VTIDLLGHGRSDRPRESWNYSIPGCAEQVVGLLDHLGLDEAVILGTSLGANTALEVCLLAPGRVRGMVIEMPVLDHALIACVVAFTPLMIGLTFGERLLRVTAAAARAVPRSLLPFYGNVLLDTVRQDSGASRRIPSSGARSRRRRSSSAIAATPSTRCRMPGCSPTSCPTRASSRPTRSSSCASRRSG